MTQKEMVNKTRDVMHGIISKVSDAINIADTAIDSIPLVGDVLSLPTKIAKVIVPNALKIGSYVGAPVGVALGNELKDKLSKPRKNATPGVDGTWAPYTPFGDLIENGGILGPTKPKKKPKGGNKS